MNVTYNVNNEETKEKTNPYFTNLQEFDFDGASEVDWFR